MRTKRKDTDQVKRCLLCMFFSILLLSAFNGPASAGERLTAAVAANFIRPMTEIAVLFFNETGIRIETSYGATGKLYAQIRRGAPFDLFLAADSNMPQLLHEQGLASAPRTYARGRVVLWSGRRGLDHIQTWQELLDEPGVQRIAIPSPETAPYGAAAADILKATGLWVKVRDRLVYGQSVAQAFQFGAGGGVEAAFISASYAGSEEGRSGTTFAIPEAGPITQRACIMNNSSHRETAKKFLAFLTADRMQPLLARYGYE